MNTGLKEKESWLFVIRIKEMSERKWALKLKQLQNWRTDKKKVIIDFDCTINVRGCDLDDAFACLYLLSSKDVDVKMITTSFGNSNEDKVYESSKKIIEDLNIDVPLYKGGIFSLDAATHMRDLVNTEDDIIILSLGSTTNTQRALTLGMDPARVKSLVLMGGITSELQFKGRIMNELNFSIDHLSTNYVFSKIKNINIITGNNCMAHRYLVPENPKYKSSYMNYMKDSLIRWTEEFDIIYQERELVLWDALAALYITNPEFFEDKKRSIELKENMARGFLKEGNDAIVNLPELVTAIDAMDYIINVIEEGGR